MKKNESFSKLLVLDQTRYLPGGYATQGLADLGATVIKVEDTGKGDFCRYDYPTREGKSYYHTALGRNKKSITLDLKSEKGKQIYYELAKKADVIVESFRPGVTKRLGVDYDTIKGMNDRIIYASFSGYGQNNEKSLKALHDINMQAQSGYLSLNGGKTSPLHLCDLASAMICFQGILAALYHREITGKCQYIDVSMFDSFVWWNSMIFGRYDFNDNVQEAQDLEYPAVCYNIYETKDHKKISFGMVEDKFWKQFCTETGMEDLIPAQLQRRQEVPEAFEKMEIFVASKTMDEWNEWLWDKDMCIAPVNDVGQAVELISKDEPEMMTYNDYPVIGKSLQVSIPHHLSELPTDLKSATPPPELGEHNREILESLGYSADDIKKFAETGVTNNRAMMNG